MRKNRGVAAITALLVVAVAASTATFMLAQQSAMLNQAALVLARAQADLFAQAGLDWARGVLAQDAKGSSAWDSLDEGWAQPIAALPVERALVSGALSDEQAKFNLNNLVRGTLKSDADLQILRRLLESQEIPPDLAYAILDWIDPDSDLAGLAGAEDGHYLALERPYRAANQPLVQVDELHRIRGFDAKRVARLKPFVTALPVRTPVNINTAPAEVIAAILPELSRDEIRALIAARQARAFRAKSDLAERLKKAPAAALDDLDVRSAFFAARVAVAQDDVQLASESLVRRDPNGTTAIIWRRPVY